MLQENYIFLRISLLLAFELLYIDHANFHSPLLPFIHIPAWTCSLQWCFRLVPLVNYPSRCSKVRYLFFAYFHITFFYHAGGHLRYKNNIGRAISIMISFSLHELVTTYFLNIKPFFALNLLSACNVWHHIWVHVYIFLLFYFRCLHLQNWQLAPKSKSLPFVYDIAFFIYMMFSKLQQSGQVH